MQVSKGQLISKQKLSKKTLFSEGFSNFIQFGPNLSAPTDQKWSSVWSFGFFDTSSTPGGMSIIEISKI